MKILMEFHVPHSQLYASLFIILVLCLAAIIIGLRVKKLDPEAKTPLWLVPMVMIVDIVNNLCKSTFGKRWKVYAPYFVGLTFFLFFSNISGLVGITNPTSYLIIDASLAMLSFFIIQITGLVSLKPKKYFKSFLEPIFIMLPINIMSEFTLPISLALRLMGNIMSGSIIGSILKGLVGMNGWLVFIAVPATLIVNLIFDLFSGVIQTLVFILLTTIFAGMKVDPKDLEIEENNNLQMENSN